MSLYRRTGLRCTREGVRIRDREEKLPAFKGGAAAARGNAVLVCGLYALKRRIGGGDRNVLLAQLGIDGIVNLPEPTGEGSRVGRHRIGGNVFGQILTAVFTGKHKRECLEEGLEGATASLGYQM
jgi:hypothetical protein